jgi:cystathionine beta-lyase
VEDPYHATAPPLYQTATFAQPSATRNGPYDYSRSGNPTRDALEEQLRLLEGAEHALAYGSGMASVSAVLRLAPPGTRVVCGCDLYGGTVRFLERRLRPSGVDVVYVDASDTEAVRLALAGGASMLFVETPGNPLLGVADLAALAGLAREAGAVFAVDGTTCSPWLQRPLEHGADVVVHSATKHLAGHSDLTAGVACTSRPELAEELAFARNAEGAALAPFEAWLLLRGLQTLGVRLERAQASALGLARLLEARPEVTRVRYPGLASHPGHALHARQADGPGSLLSFETGDPELSRALVEGLELFSIAVSFGGVRSSASLPCFMSHASVPAGLEGAPPPPRDLVRLSAGLEDPRDLAEDLERAFARAAEAETLDAGARRPMMCEP